MVAVVGVIGSRKSGLAWRIGAPLYTVPTYWLAADIIFRYSRRYNIKEFFFIVILDFIFCQIRRFGLHVRLSSHVPHLIPAWARFSVTHFLVPSTCMLLRLACHGADGSRKDPVCCHCLTAYAV